MVSFRQRLAKEFGADEKVSGIIDHLYRTAVQTERLADILKLLQYLDSENKDVENALNAFIRQIVPIINIYVPFDQREELASRLLEAASTIVNDEDAAKERI